MLVNISLSDEDAAALMAAARYRGETPNRVATDLLVEAMSDTTWFIHCANAGAEG